MFDVKNLDILFAFIIKSLAFISCFLSCVEQLGFSKIRFTFLLNLFLLFPVFNS